MKIKVKFEMKINLKKKYKNIIYMKTPMKNLKGIL